MKDRKRVYDKRNVDKLEGELQRFIEMNQTRFENEKKEEERKRRKQMKSSKKHRKSSRSKSGGSKMSVDEGASDAIGNQTDEASNLTVKSKAMRMSEFGEDESTALANQSSTINTLGRVGGSVADMSIVSGVDAERAVSLHYEEDEDNGQKAERGAARASSLTVGTTEKNSRSLSTSRR